MRVHLPLLFLAAACSSASSPSSPSTPAPTGPVDPPPAATTAPTPAPPPSLSRPDARRLTKLGGPVLAKPVLVPLFWEDDPDRAKTEALLANLPGSDYWKILEEYGVGDITVAPSVTIATTSPASFSLETIATTIAGLADGTHAPKPDGTQLYAIYFPGQMRVLNPDGSDFCVTTGGSAYHDSSTGQPVDFAYAVTPRCTEAFDEFTIGATHELFEAATDPFPLKNPAWAGTDPGHAGFRGEVGDLCDYGGPANANGVAMFGTRVERFFSNAKAAKGGDPCLPDLGLPYFDAEPVPSDDVTISDIVLGDVHGRGVRVASGASKTIPVMLYADRTLPAWKVSTSVVAQSTMQASTSVTASLDRSTGSAGDVLSLTIKRVAPSDASGDVVFLYSASGSGNSELAWSDTIYVGQ
jgi:hypothetical protein